MTPPRRAARMLVLLLAIVTSMLVAVSGPAGAGSDNPAADEAQFVALVNQARANVGAPPLAVDGQLTALGRQHAQAMADKDKIFHASPISAGVTSPWIKLGENVGTGPSAPPIMNAFINSPTHYQNIVDPAFAYIGVGVVWVGPKMFTTHRFMQLSGSTVAPPPTAPPPPPTAPPPPPPPVTTRTVPVVPVTAPPVTAPVLTPTSAPRERVAIVLIALRTAGR
ncbi:MAG TPA: CAP domain-containing protein [Acidimicrobiales bacterium]|nr:CAP domain-containing protein [Acidimicrobiales bacterium]